MSQLHCVARCAIAALVQTTLRCALPECPLGLLPACRSLRWARSRRTTLESSLCPCDGLPGQPSPLDAWLAQRGRFSRWRPTPAAIVEARSSVHQLFRLVYFVPPAALSLLPPSLLRPLLSTS